MRSGQSSMDFITKTSNLFISKELEWTREYISLVLHLIPKFKHLKRLVHTRANKKQIQRCHGQITRYSNDKDYKICLYLSYQDVERYEPLTMKIKRYSSIDILSYLAHELSHIEHWEHTAQHKQLEATMTSIFMTHLINNGYESEEAESNTSPK